MALISKLDFLFRAKTGQFDKPLQKSSKKVSGFSRALKGVGLNPAALAAAAASFVSIGAAVVAARKGITALSQSFERLNKLGDTASKLGMTAGELEKLRFVAQQTGIETTTLDMALQRMTRRVAEAAIGTGEAQGALEELGVDAQKLITMSPADMFASIAGAIKSVDNPATRLRLAFKLFDSEGAALVQTLQLGEGGLQAMFAEAERLNPLLSNLDVSGIDRAKDAIDKAKFAFQGIVDTLAIELAPLVEMVADEITDFFADSANSDALVDTFRDAAMAAARLADAVKWAADNAKTLAWVLAPIPMLVTTIAHEIADEVGTGEGGFADRLQQAFDRADERAGTLGETMTRAFTAPIEKSEKKAKKAIARMNNTIKRGQQDAPALLTAGSASAFSAVAAIMRRENQSESRGERLQRRQMEAISDNTMHAFNEMRRLNESVEALDIIKV